MIFCCLRNSEQVQCVPIVSRPTVGTWDASRRRYRQAFSCRPTEWIAGVWRLTSRWRRGDETRSVVWLDEFDTWPRPRVGLYRHRTTQISRLRLIMEQPDVKTRTSMAGRHQLEVVVEPWSTDRHRVDWTASRCSFWRWASTLNTPLGDTGDAHWHYVAMYADKPPTTIVQH